MRGLLVDFLAAFLERVIAVVVEHLVDATVHRFRARYARRRRYAHSSRFFVATPDGFIACAAWA